MRNIEVRSFYSPPAFILAKCEEEELDPIWDEVHKILERIKVDDDTLKHIDKRHNLAGNISREYDLPQLNDHMNALLQPLVKEWVEASGGDTDNTDPAFGTIKDAYKRTIVNRDCWVNFASRGEFNPPHKHHGLFSWVLWLDIPYDDIVEQGFGPGAKSNTPMSGKFDFQYMDHRGLCHHAISADRNYNGVLCFFPAYMVHQVFPFYTSDDYRITLAGNMFWGDHVDS